MLLPTPLIKGKLLQRYKRFFADVVLECGTQVTAHCANPGSMLGLKDPHLPVWLSQVPPESSRKLRYSWELVCIGETLVGVNTSYPNKIVEEALLQKKIPELAGYTTLRREVRYGQNSRIDILLENSRQDLCYVEVKNVHLKQESYAAFPDAVTVRGAKHQQELIHMAKTGHRAVIFYLVQRNDCQAFRLAQEIDPVYAAAARQARKEGVEVLCYQCHITPEEIILDKPLPIEGYE